nr:MULTISPECIES: DNA internalization-related competence protein ComEC/Rec2 [Myxococcaceae]
MGRRAGAHLAVLLGCLFAGAGLARREARVELPPGVGAGPVRLEGEVERVEPFGDATGATTRLLLRVARVDGAPARLRVGLTLRGAAPALEPGQRVQVPARLRPEEPVANPGQPDPGAARRRRAQRYTASAPAGALLVLSPAPPWRRWVSRERALLGERVRALAPTPESAALFLTLAAGERAALDDGLEEAFSRSGLAHVLSVSGLHVAALALMTLALLRRGLVRALPRLGPARSRRLDARRLAAPAAVPFVWAYVLFTGSQPPAIRSAVMATVVLLGLSLWRRADGLNCLAAAGALMVAWEPAAVADLSLQLSFLAVFSLLLLGPALQLALPEVTPAPETASAWRRGLSRVRASVQETLCASAAVVLASLPLVAATFGRVSVAGLVSNIVCMPLCGLLTGLAAGGAALSVAAAPLATPVLWAGAWASQLLIVLTRAFAAAPFATLPLHAFGALPAALYGAGLLAWALGEGRARRLGWLAPVGLLAALFLPALAPQPGLRITFLSVGQGDAIVLTSGGESAVVDAGGVPGGADTGERYVLPFLAASGVRRLALAVLSHPHPDHALGLRSVLAKVPTARLWLSADTTDGPLSRAVIAAAGPGAQVEEIEVGHPPFPLGEATLEVLGPPRDRVLLEGANDRSIVLRVRHGAVSVLLAGDVEAEGEAALLPSLGPVTVLKAPHHGSRTSSSPALLERLRPRYVVFCVGRDNRFGFPHPEVEARYRQMGTECLRTDIDGAVTLESDGRDVRLVPYLPRSAGRDLPALAAAGGHPQP